MRRYGAEEEGAVLIMVAVSLVLLFGVGAMAIDAGAAWSTRRQMVTASDAGALAAAHSHAQSHDLSNRCGSPELAELVGANSAGTEIEECTVVTTGGGTGYVTVTVRSEPVELGFGKVLGSEDPEIRSSSTASWRIPRAVIGLRPIALCVNHPSVQAVLDDADSGTPSPGTYRIPFVDNFTALCGHAPGNWGWLDLGVAANMSGKISNLNAWLRQGFYGPVAVDDCNGDSNQGDWCPGVPGNLGNSPNPGMSYLKISGKPFAVMLFDTVTGSGSDVTYRPHGFLGVVLIDYSLTGRWLEVRFHDVVLEGKCCLSNDGYARGVKFIGLCGADSDPIGKQSRCAP